VRALLAVLALALAAACGEQATGPLPTLPAGAVPGLQSETDAVTLEDLVADFGAGQGAHGNIQGFGRGTERTFQGESFRFDRVVSRTLEFDSPSDAQAYVAYLRAHLAAVYGAGTNAQALESQGRRGFLIDAASCACHRAEPTLATVVSRGDRVTYLEVNGGGARPAAVQALLARAP
jgi:hypothetical protein